MSPALRILEPGIAASIQDAGRHGFQRFGVPLSGALDTISLNIANALARNPLDTAAIEYIASGLTFQIEAECVTLALAGMAEPFTIEGDKVSVRVAPFRSAAARKGDVVRLAPPKNGSVCYLAVAGGFDIAPALGSLSTYRRALLGGFGGRLLAKGDQLPLRLADAEVPSQSISAAIAAPDLLRVMPGPNAAYFAKAAFDALTSSPYSVAPASDRMGLRLMGPRLERSVHEELPSQGTTPGALQVPADGQPILLLADRQTTGGYPRIATVIGADMAAAGRLAAGMKVRFRAVDRDEAIAALRTQRQWLASLPSQLRAAPPDALTTERLLSNNLIGGVTAGSGGT